MKFSLRNLVLFVAWAAFVSGLICQIRYEAISQRWAWGAVPDSLWIVNLFFMLIVVLLAIAVRSRQKIFWVGCAVVAVTLVILQAADLKPSTLSRSVAIWFLNLITPAGTMNSRVQMESHIMQMASVLVYCLTPVLSLLGGAFTNWAYNRSGPNAENPSAESN